MFLRDYLDVIFYQQTVDKRRRKRVFDEQQYTSGEETAPLNAPRWTKGGYNGSMLPIITRAVEKYKDNVDELDQDHSSNTDQVHSSNTERHSSKKKSRLVEEEDNN